MRINHFIGAILLVSGTTIGAGMLAVPVTTAFVGFLPSLCIFVVCWGVMLATAYFFLDVNFAVKGEPNLISMIHKTLGPWGKGVGWIFYLLLLYSLLAAYISASAPLFTLAITQLTGWTMPYWLSFFALPMIFGGFVYLGTLGVDLINRILMVGLCLSYFLLLTVLPQYIQGDLLLHFDFQPSLIALPVVITAFGYHIIIPSLTTYMHHDKKKLRAILLIGSLIPLLIYILWQLLTLGIIPIKGEFSLAQAWREGSSATTPLTQIVKTKWVQVSIHFFSFFAIVTSFLGVSLSLSDFLADGLKIKKNNFEKNWKGKLLTLLLTFIPPLVFLFTYQRGFIVALEYAGVFLAILLIFLPAIMAWHLERPKFYKTVLGRLSLIFVMLFAFFIITIDILKQWGAFNTLLSRCHV